MRVRLCGHAAALVFVVAAVAAPAASASIAPTIALDQSSGTAAGGTANLGVTLKFAPTSADSPKDMTMVLPPGLLANASIDGGACLRTADLTDSACQVGSGTVTAYPVVSGQTVDIPITTPVTFDLVPPPAAGDLAGIAVNNNGTQIGTTADVKIRPSGDPAGVGATLTFLLPDSLAGSQIAISEIASTFDGLRYPTTCPSTPANISVSVDSYDDPAVRTVTAPLQVTGCSGLAYSPTLQASATRDSSDDRVALVTDVSQTGAQAPSQSLSLSLPVSVLSPNLESLKSLCASPGAGCAPVGSATATSPLYPRPLTGQAYLTGSFLNLSLTIMFPSPFPLTLTGKVDLTQNGTVFSGLPDIPLSDLKVAIYGGSNGLFRTDCRVQTGSASAQLTDQNGDRTVTASTPLTVAGCPAGSARHAPAAPRLASAILARLDGGRLRLTLHVASAPGSPPLSKLAVALPRQVAFVGHRSRGREVVRAVTVRGARLRAAIVSHGQLVLTLRRAVRALTLTIGPSGLRRRGAIGRRMTAVIVAGSGAGRRYRLRRQLALRHGARRSQGGRHGSKRTGARR